MRERALAHKGLWLGYAISLSVAVPWYRHSGTLDPLWLGMPLWGWVALAGAAAMSALTLFAALRLWPETADEDRDG